MEIRPIKTEHDYDAALAEVEALWGAEPDTPEGDKLDVLITLVEAYEAKHHPIAPPDPIEAILFRLEQAGLERKDLEPYIGHSGRVSDIERRFPRSLNHLLNDFSHRVDSCTCFMNDGESPVLVFEQRGNDREIVHDDYYQLLLEEAKR